MVNQKLVAGVQAKAGRTLGKPAASRTPASRAPAATEETVLPIIEETTRDNAAASATFADLLVTSIEKQVAVLKNSLAKIGDGSDPERIHDARVAIRRLRVCLQLGKAVSGMKEGKSVDRALRRIARGLGVARDIDVILGDARGYGERLEGKRALSFARFIGALEERKSISLVGAAEHLDRDAYGKIGDRLAEAGAFIKSHESRRPPRVDAALAALAAYGDLMAFDTRVRTGEVNSADGSFHEIRVAAKRFRYALEAVDSVLGPRAAPIIAELKALQDYLGTMNDLANASRAAATHVSEQLNDEAARYLASCQRRLERKISAFRSLWARYTSTAFRRRLYSMLAGD